MCVCVCGEEAWGAGGGGGGVQGLPALGEVVGLGADWPPVEAPGHPRNPTSYGTVVINGC